MLNISELKFDEKGLIPAIVVDAKTKKVLYNAKKKLDLYAAAKAAAISIFPNVRRTT